MRAGEGSARGSVDADGGDRSRRWFGVGDEEGLIWVPRKQTLRPGHGESMGK